jgi:hypothetical protein
VLTTWTLWTIPDATAALMEMRRVLTPSGRLLFVEHGMPPEAGVRSCKTGPAWKRISGGCHLNRPIQSPARTPLVRTSVCRSSSAGKPSRSGH